jgi:NDP-hexose-3-ketoreductase
MIHTPIKIGILGCAKIARRSMIPAIRQVPEAFELVAVASRELGKAAAFADEFGCEAIAGYEAMIARQDIKALYVPLPTGLHAEWVGKAIAAGKHVYVEKSFAPQYSQAQVLVALAKQHDVAVMEGYMFLYHRQQAVVSALLSDGVIGELRHFFGSFGFPPLPPDDFRYDDAVGGGVLMDAAGYPLRAAHHFLGEDMQVMAASVHEDTARGTATWGSAFLSNQRGLGASIAFGFDNAYQCRYELWGSRGKLIAERAYTPGPAFSPRLVLETAGGVREIHVDPDDHFVGALLSFREAILSAAPRARHYADILRQSQALEAIRALCGHA